MYIHIFTCTFFWYCIVWVANFFTIGQHLVSAFCYLLLGAISCVFFTLQHILQAEVLANFILDYLFKDICTVNRLGRQRLSPGTKGRFIYHLA